MAGALGLTGFGDDFLVVPEVVLPEAAVEDEDAAPLPGAALPGKDALVVAGFVVAWICVVDAEAGARFFLTTAA